MEKSIREWVSELSEKDDGVRKTALDKLMALTEEPIDWIYEFMDELSAKLDADNSYQRNIGAMLIASLAKSDSECRLAAVIPRFVKQMDDEKFITARITLQHAGRFGAARAAFAAPVAAGLLGALRHNRHLSTHGNLIRLDVVNSLREVLGAYPDAADIQAIHDAISDGCDAKEAMKLFALLDGRTA